MRRTAGHAANRLHEPRTPRSEVSLWRSSRPLTPDPSCRGSAVTGLARPFLGVHAAPWAPFLPGLGRPTRCSATHTHTPPPPSLPEGGSPARHPIRETVPRQSPAATFTCISGQNHLLARAPATWPAVPQSLGSPPLSTRNRIGSLSPYDLPSCFPLSPVQPPGTAATGPWDEPCVRVAVCAHARAPSTSPATATPHPGPRPPRRLLCSLLSAPGLARHGPQREQPLCPA